MATEIQEKTSAQKTQEKLQQEILDTLLKLTGRSIRDDEVKFEGQSICLPEGTTIQENIDFLVRLLEELEEPTGFSRSFNFKIWDVANATASALKKAFGSMRHTGTWLSPPTMVDVPNGPHTTVQVPFGEFIVPALPQVQFSVQPTKDDKYGVVGTVTAFGPKKYKAYIESIFDLINEYLEKNSLYRGKAFTDEEKPEFIDTDAIDPSKIIYSADVTAQLGANVYTRLDYPDAMKELGVPFKSAILLEGEFGVGKTEALNLIAKRAVEREVTFIKVSSGGDLMQAMQTARMYAPSVVAFEDVDTVASGADEATRIQQVLEAFDGQQAKLNPVMVLITTNYVETLHKGMVRPGRIDAIIHIGPPDAAGIKKLVEARTPVGVLSGDIKWDEVTTSMEGYFPSFVVEATSRAMRYAVARIGGSLKGDALKTKDLVDAATELRRQFDLHNGAGVGQPRPELERALGDLVKRALNETGGVEGTMLDKVQEAIEEDGEVTRKTVQKQAAGVARHVTGEVQQDKEHTTEEADRVIETL